MSDNENDEPEEFSKKLWKANSNDQESPHFMKKRDPLNPTPLDSPASDFEPERHPKPEKNQTFPPIVTIDGRVDTDIDHLMDDLPDESSSTLVEEGNKRYPKPHVFSVITGSLDDDVDSLANYDGTMEHTLVDAPTSFSPGDLRDVHSKDTEKRSVRKIAKKESEVSDTDRSHNKLNIDDEEMIEPSGTMPSTGEIVQRLSHAGAVMETGDATIVHQGNMEENFGTSVDKLPKSDEDSLRSEGEQRVSQHAEIQASLGIQESQENATIFSGSQPTQTSQKDSEYNSTSSKSRKDERKKSAFLKKQKDFTEKSASGRTFESQKESPENSASFQSQKYDAELQRIEFEKSQSETFEKTESLKSQKDSIKSSASLSGKNVQDRSASLKSQDGNRDRSLRTLEECTEHPVFAEIQENEETHQQTSPQRFQKDISDKDESGKASDVHSLTQSKANSMADVTDITDQVVQDIKINFHKRDMTSSTHCNFELTAKEETTPKTVQTLIKEKPADKAEKQTDAAHNGDNRRTEEVEPVEQAHFTVYDKKRSSANHTETASSYNTEVKHRDKEETLYVDSQAKVSNTRLNMALPRSATRKKDLQNAVRRIDPEKERVAQETLSLKRNEKMDTFYPSAGALEPEDNYNRGPTNQSCCSKVISRESMTCNSADTVNDRQALGCYAELSRNMQSVLESKLQDFETKHDDLEKRKEKSTSGGELDSSIQDSLKAAMKVATQSMSAALKIAEALTQVYDFRKTSNTSCGHTDIPLQGQQKCQQSDQCDIKEFLNQPYERRKDFVIENYGEPKDTKYLEKYRPVGTTDSPEYRYRQEIKPIGPPDLQYRYSRDPRTVLPADKEYRVGREMKIAGHGQDILYQRDPRFQEFTDNEYLFPKNVRPDRYDGEEYRYRREMKPERPEDYDSRYRRELKQERFDDRNMRYRKEMRHDRAMEYEYRHKMGQDTDSEAEYRYHKEKKMDYITLHKGHEAEELHRREMESRDEQSWDFKSSRQRERKSTMDTHRPKRENTEKKCYGEVDEFRGEIVPADIHNISRRNDEEFCPSDIETQPARRKSADKEKPVKKQIRQRSNTLDPQLRQNNQQQEEQERHQGSKRQRTQSHSKNRRAQSPEDKGLKTNKKNKFVENETNKNIQDLDAKPAKETKEKRRTRASEKQSERKEYEKNQEEQQTKKNTPKDLENRTKQKGVIHNVKEDEISRARQKVITKSVTEETKKTEVTVTTEPLEELFECRTKEDWNLPKSKQKRSKRYFDNLANVIKGSNPTGDATPADMKSARENDVIRRKTIGSPVDANVIRDSDYDSIEFNDNASKERRLLKKYLGSPEDEECSCSQCRGEMLSVPTGEKIAQRAVPVQPGIATSPVCDLDLAVKRTVRFEVWDYNSDDTLAYDSSDSSFTFNDPINYETRSNNNNNNHCTRVVEDQQITAECKKMSVYAKNNKIPNVNGKKAHNVTARPTSKVTSQWKDRNNCSIHVNEDTQCLLCETASQMKFNQRLARQLTGKENMSFFLENVQEHCLVKSSKASTNRNNANDEEPADPVIINADEQDEADADPEEKEKEEEEDDEKGDEAKDETNGGEAVTLNEKEEENEKFETVKEEENEDFEPPPVLLNYKEKLEARLKRRRRPEPEPFMGVMRTLPKIGKPKKASRPGGEKRVSLNTAALMTKRLSPPKVIVDRGILLENIRLCKSIASIKRSRGRIDSGLYPPKKKPPKFIDEDDALKLRVWDKVRIDEENRHLCDRLINDVTPEYSRMAQLRSYNKMKSLYVHMPSDNTKVPHPPPPLPLCSPRVLKANILAKQQAKTIDAFFRCRGNKECQSKFARNKLSKF